MAENPLLPNEELRALLALTKRCAKLEAKANRSSGPGRKSSSFTALPSREALLAATTLQLKPGDLLLPEAHDAVAASLAPRPANSDQTASLLPDTLSRDHSRTMLATAMAAALRMSGRDGLVLNYLRADTAQRGWAEAYEWAQGGLLPLITVIADTRGSQAFRPSTREVLDGLTWEAVERIARRLKLPVLCVDGEDAVAVYRVMQESVIRARAGGGPAILWAMLPSAGELAAPRSSSAKPVARLTRYLRTRKISS